MSTEVARFLQSTKTKLVHLNLFRDRSTNAEKLRKQILSTRLYLVAFTSILFILVLYTSLNKKTITINVPLTDLTQYEQLQSKYPNTLSCPCSEISIEYDLFIQLTPSYHDVCSSDFVTQRWIDYLFDETKMNDRDFHATASAQFQVLASLCQLTQDTINASLTQFYSTKFISNQLVSMELFQTESNGVVNLFQKLTPQTFKRTLDIIRGVVQGNLFMSAYQTNWKYTLFEANFLSPFYTNPITYNNNSCTCGTSAKCSQPVTLNNSVISGLLIGCYPVEAMLQSSLQCVYNQTCLDLLVSNLGQRLTNVTFDILSSHNPYGLNETVEHMIDRLFVDQWYMNYSYHNYFQRCHPTSCTYSFIQNFDILYTLTTVLGLYGGLSITLGLLIPFLLHTIFRIFEQKQTVVVPFSTATDQET